MADPTSAIDGKHIYINSAANNTLDGSETFQGDVNFNNHRIKNVHTAVSNYDVVNKLFCETTYRKLTNDDQLLKTSSDGRWGTDDKTKTDPKRAEYDGEAARQGQKKDTTVKKIDMWIANSSRSQFERTNTPAKRTNSRSTTY